MALQQETNRQLIQQRLNLFRVPVLLIFFILAARLWQLQIINGSEYTVKAERNRIRTIELIAPRGVISDRYNKVLVENRSIYNVLLYREEMKNEAETIQFLKDALQLDPEEIKARLRHNKGVALYRPLIVKEDVGIQEITVVEAHKRDHPEVQLGSEPRRKYHFGRLAAHLLGYVGEISEADLTSNLFQGASSGTLIGQSGVERHYNRFLAGKDGQRNVLVDSMGREVGLHDEQIDPIIGGEVKLTIDLDIQAVAEKALEGKVGAIVAMDPRNGEILALSSSPSFDPNDFSTRISGETWNAIINDPDRPMQNRAIQNSYSPGSVFKVIMAEAGMEEGVFEDDPVIFCNGAAAFYGRVFHCHTKGGHGAVRLEQAIAKSCNIFFYDLGRRLGIEKIAAHARGLGIGERAGIDLPGEKSGIMPSPEWKKQARKDRWYPSETMSVAIGQGAVSATPLQIVRAISAIATGGVLTTPHVLLRAEKDSPDEPKWPIRTLSLGESNSRRIREGMWLSVNGGGTGHNAAVPGHDICGKTGTVQVVGNDRKHLAVGDTEDHSWFAGFGSRDNPEIAVVAFVEHGGMGGIAAAPMARQVFQAYYDKKKPKPIVENGVVPLAMQTARQPEGRAQQIQAERKTDRGAQRN